MREDWQKTSNITSMALLRTISTGFWSSRALSSAIEIGLFSAISAKEYCLEELAKELKVTERGLEVLLRYLQSAGLIVRLGKNKITSSEIARKFLDPSKDLYLGFEATISADVWRAFESLTDKVIGGQATNETRYFSSLNKAQNKGFFETMRVQGQACAEDLAAKIDIQHRNVLVDVGCGPAAYSMAFLQQYPSLNVVLIDLPHVLEITRKKILKTYFADRVIFLEGSFWEVLPRVEYDCLLFSRILHDWSDEQCIALLKRFIRGLNSNGMIIVHEEMIHDVENPEWWPVILDLFLFCLIGSGRTRTVDELKGILKKVNCMTKDVHRIDEFTSVMTASKSTSR